MQNLIELFWLYVWGLLKHPSSRFSFLADEITLSSDIIAPVVITSMTCNAPGPFTKQELRIMILRPLCFTVGAVRYS